MDYFEFRERGTTFEVVGPFSGHGHMLQVRVPGQELEVSEHPDIEAVGRAVDAWLAAHPAAGGADRGFDGYSAEVWNHEERDVQTVHYPTRGSLLAIWEDGTLPSPDEFADALEWSGDLVLTVTDGGGRKVVDRRERTEARLAAFALEDSGFRR